MACMRRAVLGLLLAEDAGIVPRSAEGVVKTMTAIVTVLEAAGLMVSERRTETMLLRIPGQTSLAPPLVTEPAGQRYRQNNQIDYTISVSSATALISRSKSNDGSVSCGHASTVRPGVVWYEDRST